MSPINEDDLDRLADYVAGLLDPASAGEVHQKIDSDPGWSRAEDALRSSGPRLQRTLAELADPPIPPDVMARLHGALAAEAASLGSPGVDDRPGEAGTATDPDRATVIRLDRWRQFRRFSLGAVAAAAALAVCFGGTVLVRGMQHGNSASTTAGKADRRFNQQDSAGAGASAPNAASGALAAPPSGGPAPIRLATGTNYTPANLGTIARRTTSGSRLPAQAAPEAIPGDLARLANPSALSACLVAVQTTAGGTATTVDFARYQGSPALIILLTGGSGERAVVVGADCGLPGSGPASIYTAPVG